MAAADASGPVGVWRGVSQCATDSPSCHNEQVVYYIEAIPGRSDAFSVRADKIVDGKAITMGIGPWKYDPAHRTLSFQWNQQLWLITQDGDRFDGKLTGPNNVVYRRMSLTREHQPPQP
ncbi:MAG TPA: hypothetical protein VJS11_14215 [Acidobacteriaceae bacterium]|nr:hypothetical protein [Acidobacteriaceae bacterium]